MTIDTTDELVFDPDSTAIAPGTTVVWDNVGTVGHSVTAYEDGIPESARTVGIVAVSAMVAIVAFAYFFLKYGGDYGLE